MKRLAVLDDYDGSIAKLKCWQKLAGIFEISFFNALKSGHDLKDFDAVVLLRERTVFNRETILACKNLKHIALTGRLSGQADFKTLKEKAISASYTAGSGSAPAELTIGLLIEAAKKISHHDRVMRKGGWHSEPARNLAGKTLGVLGLGRIGTKVTQFAKLMDMNVVSWGLTPDGGRSEKLGISRVSLEECLSSSDFICICLRLSDSTRGLLGKAELSSIKNGATLINTARAEIVTKEALYAELSSERISACLDVHYEEPLPHADPLRQLPNVVLSPHMGYVTAEVYDLFYGQVVENLFNWNHGRPFNDALNG